MENEVGAIDLAKKGKTEQVESVNCKLDSWNVLNEDVYL